MNLRNRDFKTPADLVGLTTLLDAQGEKAWDQLRDSARRSPSVFSDQALALLGEHASEAPRTFFALLLDIAARDPLRHDVAVALFMRLMPVHVAEALASAGYNLHEYCRILSADWVALAMRHVDANPQGAWGILDSAAMYRPGLILPEHGAWMDAHRGGAPRSFFIAMFSLAGSSSDPDQQLLGRALQAWPEHPVEAIDAAAMMVSSHPTILVAELGALALRFHATNPERSWEFFASAAGVNERFMTDDLLRSLEQLAQASPGTIFGILNALIISRPDQAPELLERYAALVLRHPAAGIHGIKYHFQIDAMRFLRPSLMQALCQGFAHDAYGAYDILQRCVDRRPELITAEVLDAAIANIEHATNYAFGFFTKLLKVRPEFTPECTLALFDCLAREPVNRAYMRAEELETIIAISEAASFRTALDQELRSRTRTGSRRARALMAIMFRHRLRAQRHVLLEALRHAGTLVMLRTIPEHALQQAGGTSEKYTPIWDFLMYLIDHGGDDVRSTAAAETFLEGMYQLQYLYGNDYERQSFIAKLDIGYPAAQALPTAAAFLGSDPSVIHPYAVLQALSARFAIPVSLTAIEAFATRRQRVEIEVQRIRLELDGADATRRRGLAERERSLSRQLRCWADPEYQNAFHDPQAEARLAADDRALLKLERKNLYKQVMDSLHAETQRVALTAVERLRLDLYRLRLRDYLGHEVDIDAVDPQVLPAFLWFGAVQGMAKNTRYLRRLIEDRLQGKTHDWLWTEPAVLAWRERVLAIQPAIALEHWRAPYRTAFQYSPRDAAAEKQARISADIAQTRVLLERAGATGFQDPTYEELVAALARLQSGIDEAEPAAEGATTPNRPARPAIDPALLQEITMNLERIRITQKAQESDYDGSIILSVESDPFEILFMGEYGFSSCLGLRGINSWSAVSNAIDIDKTIVWAREPGGNVVGRRLLALVPEGILTYHTYTNRNGLALDRLFDTFIADYARHCGTRLIHSGSPGALLSDRWYDDGCR